MTAAGWHTWAVASEEDAGCRVEVASDASLDEGAIIRTVFEPSPLSSGTEYFLGLQQGEAEIVREALEALLDTDVDARGREEREEVEALQRRVERLVSYIRGEVV